MSTDSLPNVHIGQMFPSEYLDTIANQLYFTLCEWLINQKAPQEFLDALDASLTLTNYTHWKENNNLCDALTDDIPIAVAQAVAFIKLFGGRYSDGASIIGFENKVKWVEK